MHKVLEERYHCTREQFMWEDCNEYYQYIAKCCQMLAMCCQMLAMK